MARKSRITPELSKQNSRLGESPFISSIQRRRPQLPTNLESISNQRAIIEETHCRVSGRRRVYHSRRIWTMVFRAPIDDEREDFQRMLSDIKRGRINCVIVKDLCPFFSELQRSGLLFG